MASITTIQGSDIIKNSRADINNNFTNLNSDKIETSYLDTDTTLAANSDSKIATQKAVKAYVDSGGNQNASETTRGIVEEATDAEVTAGTATGATGAKLFVTPAKLATNISTKLKFGGTGADGALSINSGTTNVDLGGLAVVIKNYTSISITGTGVLGFTNPHSKGTLIILKSQGAVTITSSAVPCIDTRLMGGAGGIAPGAASDGAAGQNANGLLASDTLNGGAGLFAPGTVSGGSPASYQHFYFDSPDKVYRRFIQLIPGAGGGSPANPAAGGSASVTGGRGGGALLVECAGALNFTGTINSSGQDGQSGGSATGSSASGGGGGGGSAGMVAILYNSLIANSGTITAAGGAGGNGATAAGSSDTCGGGGSGAASYLFAGGSGGYTGSGATNGGAAAGLGAGGGGGAGKDGAGAGGTGGSGGSSMSGVVALNTEFA